ncbi:MULTISPECIES: hypothetical protein [unclassified Shewanella]|uniref:hypothetical protein n=1 Tax=unclassified Shewanella TaxID=196818 RepID=UPI0021D9FC73|nr:MULTISPECIES: hypothetical protein [unclassified Shewanella]MCU8003275.1 hypothetical protein [Shewanella sp. SM96]MCU8081735.1 hypothetical protein [Shewanella sp. SM23]MCU8088068.1 hypothetical protein [Shewanella sp. SM21]
MQQITQKLATAKSITDVTFDDMDVINEPPWMASRRVTEAMEFGVPATDAECFFFVI